MSESTDKLIRFMYALAYRAYLCFCFFIRPASRGACVAVWHDGCILVIGNSYKKARGLPGGCVDRGESDSAAAARELEEEVGLRVDEKRLTFVGNYFSTHEFKKDTAAFFEVTLSSRPEIRIDNREVVWAAFLPPVEVLGMNLTPQVREYLENHTESRGKKES